MGLSPNLSFQSILLHSGSTIQTLGNTGVYHTKPYVHPGNPLGTSMWAHRGPLPGHLHSPGTRHMHTQCWPCGDTGKYEMGLLPPRAFYLVEWIQLIHVKCFKQLYHVQCTRLPPAVGNYRLTCLDQNELRMRPGCLLDSPQRTRLFSCTTRNCGHSIERAVNARENSTCEVVPKTRRLC